MVSGEKPIKFLATIDIYYRLKCLNVYQEPGETKSMRKKGSSRRKSGKPFRQYKQAQHQYWLLSIRKRNRSFFYGESFKFISFIAIHTWLAVFDFCCVFVLNRCKTFDWRRKIVNRHYLSQLSFLLLLLSSQNNKFSIEIQISFIGHAEISRNVQAVKRAISFSCLFGCSLSSFRTICDETWSSPAFSRVKRSM